MSAQLCKPGEFIVPRYSYVLRRPVDLASRIALRRVLRYGTDFGDILSATKRLALRWGRLVSPLLDGGWDLPSNTYRKRLMFCPPVGVRSQPRIDHTCCQYRICPWCWARQHVRPLLSRLLELYNNPEARRSKSTPHLVEVQTWRLIPKAVSLDRVIRRMADVSEVYLNDAFYYKPLGYRWLQSIEPSWWDSEACEATDDYWAVHHSLVALVRPKHPTPLPTWPLDSRQGEKVIRRVARHSRVTVKRAAIVAGRFARYPAGLLFKEYLEETIAILNAMRETSKTERCFARSSGILRRPHKRTL